MTAARSRCADCAGRSAHHPRPSPEGAAPINITGGVGIWSSTSSQSSVRLLWPRNMPSCKLAPVILLAAVISLHAAQPAEAANNATSAATLTIAGGGCVGHSWGGDGSKFGYSVLLTQLSVATTCNATDVRISKLYVEGACADTRDNSLS